MAVIVLRVYMCAVVSNANLTRNSEEFTGGRQSLSPLPFPKEKRFLFKKKKKTSSSWFPVCKELNVCKRITGDR